MKLLLKNWLTQLENSRESPTTSRVDSAEDRILGLKELDEINEEYISLYTHTSVYVHTCICEECIHTYGYVCEKIYIHTYICIYIHTREKKFRE